MKITLKEIPIKDLFQGYKDNGEDGVVGYNGRLNIRPPYQREFVYKNEERNKVIETVRKQFPLNVMYWAKTGDDTYEVLDGQQRTISICEYLEGNFSINWDKDPQKFHGLLPDQKTAIENYNLMVYICEGTPQEKLDWFRTINISGVKLTEQELRNAVYTGPWLSDAKRYFSRKGCQAANIGKDYVEGTPERQDLLEVALKWINNGKIKEYMAEHQNDPTAVGIWSHYQAVITWISSTFPKIRRKEMQANTNLWGELYNQFKDKTLDPKALETRIQELLMDDDVTSKKGVYPYVLTNNEKHLSLRTFTDSQKREAYERQKGICPKCGNHFKIEEMEGDHITPWAKGGKTTAENCQMLCKDCNRKKSAI